jgi:DNA-binding transcriptional LysR family regulator
LAEFLAETHVAVTTSGSGHSILENTLEAQRIPRKIGLTVPSFLGLMPVLATLDFVATLPERLATLISETTAIKIFPLPVPVPSFVIVQQWHERYTHDPANCWLRELIAELFTYPVTSAARSAPRARAAHHQRN